MIVACLKWVDQRPEPDTHGVIASPDVRFAGVSAADRAALEWSLRSRDVSGGDVVAVTAGPVGADAVLLDALAAGADRAIRIDVPFGESSAVVGAAIAAVSADAQQIWCGDYSPDRGTGSVPAFIAASLGIAQALGLVRVEFVGNAVEALRRLDGGRRERLSVDGPAVLSVEGSTAMLRRAPLRALRAAAGIEVVHATSPARATVSDGTYRPYRPRPRALAAPAGADALQRVKALTGMSGGGAAASSARADPIVLDPAEAADQILAALREWSYLPPT